MNLKDLQKLSDVLISLGDFASSNSDADESGIAEDMSIEYREAMKIIDEAKYKIYLKNALARLKRNKNK